MRTLFATALVLLCAGCSGSDPAAYRRTWQRVDLPGFSVVIPTGEVVSTSTETWTGKHHVKLEGSLLDRWLNDVAVNGTVSVSWSAEKYSRDEWSANFLPAVMAGMKGAIPGARVMSEMELDEGRWYTVVGTEQAPLALGVVQCDAFTVNIAYAHYHDSAKQAADLEEMMSTVRCDAGTQAPARPMAVTRLPADFAPLEGEDGLQMYQSPDGETVAINFTNGDVQSDEKMYISIMRPLLAQSQGLDPGSLTLSKVEHPRNASSPRMILRVERAGSAPSYVGALYCASIRQSVLSIWSAPNPSDARAIERIGQVDCP